MRAESNFAPVIGAKTREAADAPLIAHIIYRLDMGGLENGLVNLINRIPAERFRHAIICLTGYSEFRRRIRRSDVSVFALDKPPGNSPLTHFKLWRLLKQLRPDIVHTRNLAALEGTLPAALAGVPGAHPRRARPRRGDLDGSNRKPAAAAPAVQAVRAPIHRAVERPGALPARADRRAAREGCATLQWGGHRAVPSGARRARAAAADPGFRAARCICHRHGRPHAGGEGPAHARARVRAAAADGAAGGAAAAAAGDGRRRAAARASRRHPRPGRRRRACVACRRARRRAADHARAGPVRAAFARRGHFQHHPGSDGERAAGGGDRGGRQPRTGGRGAHGNARSAGRSAGDGAGHAALLRRCGRMPAPGPRGPPDRRAAISA